jgi:hypothetical protein
MCNKGRGKKGERPMKTFNRFVACALVLPIVWLFLPTAALCVEKKTPSKAAKKTITRHEPKILASPEKQMTPEQAAKVKKKKPNWLWIGLGAAAAVALAIAIGGSGGGGGGGGGTGNGGSPENPEGEGDIVVGW